MMRRRCKVRRHIFKRSSFGSSGNRWKSDFSSWVVGLGLNILKCGWDDMFNILTTFSACSAGSCSKERNVICRGRWADA